MEDPNLIAMLLPAMSEDDDKNSRSWEAIRMNKLKCNPPQGEIKSDLRSRESTVSLEDEEGDTQNETSYPRLQLTFNPGPKAGQGLVLGTDPSCDIVLPRLSMISRRHCALTFDAERRLILRDFSRHGTIVTYDDKGRETRRHFTWILGGHRVPTGTKKIIIEIQGISFQIIVSTHGTHLDLYSANVDRFLWEANANNELPLGVLGVHSTSSTAAPSGAHTPSHGPIRLKQETLGMGTFAVVRRFWDVSTGFEYAYKEPRDKKKFDRKIWEKEADIMSQISHDHVVELVDTIFTPWPRLILEYVPFGSLEDLTNLSVEECVTILCQGLSALVDLHEREEPIVHRDIKPGNILLQSLDPLHIKFTDFGLSRASNDLTTMCGTPLYLAPEVYMKQSYTPVVDIWALGVVVFKLSYGLPNYQGYAGRRWCKRIIEKANDYDSEDLIDFLTTAMVVMDPKSRHSAQDCYHKASRLSIPCQGRCLTPTLASYAEGCEKTVVGFPAVSPDRHLAAHPNSIASSEIRRYIRSDVPTPGSNTSISTKTRKRSTRPSVSSSSSGGRHTKRHGKATVASSSSCPQCEEPEHVLDLFGEGWLQDPNCVGSSVAAMGEERSNWSSWDNSATEPSKRSAPRSIQESVGEHNSDYDPHLIRGGDPLAQDAYLVDTVVHDGGGGGWTDSEAHMAAGVLYAIREDERL